MAAQNRTSEEGEIRQLIDGFQQAIRTKDLGGVLSVYAPDIVSFDLVPPEQHPVPWTDSWSVRSCC
jgi:ketosteroid isomerase-like protein